VALQGETAEHGVQLYSADTTTGSWRRVTDVTGYPVFPDWSPNGRRLAFEVVSPSGERCGSAPVGPAPRLEV